MKDRKRTPPTFEDLQRELERTRVQIREVEHPPRHRHPPPSPRDIEPGQTPPTAPTLH
jgi:hypothetical protein